jgi:hypothetical protein
MRAAIVCGEIGFQTFLKRTRSKEWRGALGEGATRAADAMRNVLGIESRKQLATDIDALDRFDKLMASYECWKRGEAEWEAKHG